MAVTRSMKARRPWVDLPGDLLLLVMMQLSVIDFVAFSGTCKSWRLFASINKKKFMETRLPMTISFSTKDCRFYNYQNREFKTVLPHLTGRMCVGVTCGHFILFGKKTRDIWLVNPITSNELHFHDVPFHFDPLNVRAILVYSPLMSEWVFVISFKCYNRIWFSSAGKQKACWDYLESALEIHDIHAFKGKIYIIYGGGCLLYEMRLHPSPILKKLVMKNSPGSCFRSEFVSSGEKLYVLRKYLEHAESVFFELDFDKMECVTPENTFAEYTIFMSEFKSSAIIKPETLVECETHYRRSVYLLRNTIRIGRSFTTNILYFPHDCLNENHLCE